MVRMTEGEVQSLVRRFLLKNDFRIYTRTSNNELLHYRIMITNPPMYKNPDHVAIKNNYVLVIEDKILFSHLVQGQFSDMTKIISFLENQQACEEFRNQLTRTVPSLTNPTIIGCLASLAPKTRINLPKQFIYISVRKLGDEFAVDLFQDAGVRNLFTFTSSNFSL